VFYKVGHHGSHNATLRAQGLELMTSPDLVAMIPVNEEQAKKKEWAMPFAPLLQRLEEKTRGRILRMDQDEAEKPERTPQDLWNQFVAGCASDPGPDHLWMEYTISG
jgi:hypothetical protein